MCDFFLTSLAQNPIPITHNYFPFFHLNAIALLAKFVQASPSQKFCFSSLALGMLTMIRANLHDILQFMTHLPKLLYFNQKYLFIYLLFLLK